MVGWLWLWIGCRQLLRSKWEHPGNTRTCDLNGLKFCPFFPSVDVKVVCFFIQFVKVFVQSIFYTLISERGGGGGKKKKNKKNGKKKKKNINCGGFFFEVVCESTILKNWVCERGGGGGTYKWNQQNWDRHKRNSHCLGFFISLTSTTALRCLVPQRLILLLLLPKWSSEELLKHGRKRSLTAGVRLHSLAVTQRLQQQTESSE